MAEEGQRGGGRQAFVCVRRGVAWVVSWMSSAPQGTVIGIDGWLSVTGSSLVRRVCGLARGCSFQLRQTWPQLTAKAFVHGESGVEVDVHLCVCNCGWR